jgi:CBS domain-containing protein
MPFNLPGGVVQKKKVLEILLPYRRHISPSPALSADEKISRAIQIMLDHDVQRMAVVRKKKLIGMVRLEDALFAMGLQQERRQD